MKSQRVEIRKRFVNWTPGYATIMRSGREGVAEKVEGQPCDDGSLGRKYFKKCLQSTRTLKVR